MKILLLATYFYPYREGEEALDKTHLASSPPEIARMFSRKHKVTVIARRTESTERRTVENAVEVSRVRFINFAGLRLVSWVLSAFLEIMKLNRMEKHDVIVCWDWSTALPAILTKPFLKIPVICSVRNQSQAYATKGSLKFPFYYVLERFAFNRSDLVIYSSSWVKKTVDAVMEVKAPSIVLHHGIDLKKFNPRVKSDIAKKLKLKRFAIGFFGRLVKEKGIYLLIKAFAKFKKSSKDSSLLVVGEGPEGNELKSLSKQLGVEKDVHFVGFVHRNYIPKYMQVCDVIVLPSKSEGFSSVVLEAMAMGKVFVGTEVGGVPEIIEDWKNGVKMRSYDVEELCNILKKLQKDKNLIKRIGKNAYNFIIEKGYDWEHYIKRWEKVLESLKP